MPEHTTLLAAMLAVQGEMPTLPKDATNPHFKSKFTSLDTIVERAMPIANAHGLVWIAKPGQDEQGKPVLNYVLGHAKSGEREEGSMPLLLQKADPQGQGSALTYARRYALCAVLNLVADEDDDGNAGSAAGAARKGKGASGQASAPRPAAATGGLSTDTLDQLRKAYSASGLKAADVQKIVRDEFGVESGSLKVAMAALTEDQATALMMRLAKAGQS